MIFPENIEQKIGFDRVRFLLSEECLSAEGRNWVFRLKWSNSFEQISLWLQHAKEAMNMIKTGIYLLEGRLPDIDRLLQHLKIEGFVLEVSEFHQIRIHTLQFIRIFNLLTKSAELYPNLNALLDNTVSETRIIQIIDRILDPNGILKPNASAKLAELTEKINRAEREIDSVIHKLYEKYKSKGILADTDITIKDGRPVLPVLSEHKKKVRGYVHDESGGGKILYIEPDELIELSNTHRELELEKKREIDRILRKSTGELSVYTDVMSGHFRVVGLLDFIQSKSVLGLKLQATVPKLVNQPLINLKRARHPLLYLSMARAGKSIVDQNIYLNNEQRIMVISGPNGGGKSVTLKTTGIIQYMVQCGLPITAEAETECGIFNDLLLDMGDDQSIETNLSSYTSHLHAMKFISENVSDASLVLIDELGTGTDPTFGGPIAQAFLQEINQQGSFGIITTHFSNLKKIADKQKGLFNASMGYDTQKLQPLYTLISDKPGSSYAFEAAIKAGIAPHIIENAKKLTDQRTLKLDTLLAEAESERNQYLLDKARLAQKEKLADTLIKEYTELKKTVQESKKAMLDMARDKALTIIENANRDVEKTIKDIKENQAQKQQTQNIRKNLEQKKKNIKKELGLPVFSEETPVKILPSALKIGDLVRIKGGQMLAELLEIKGENATIMNGSIKTRVKLENLEAAQPEKNRLKSVEKRGIDLIEKQREFRSEIDVRGLRGEEALRNIEFWLDEAHVLGFNKLKIIHGKGDGILKKLIRDYLRRQSIVLHIASEHADLGGEGVSLVEIR